MNRKHFTIAGLTAGLCLIAALASAGQPEEKGIITTLDASRGLISIDTHDMYIGGNIRIQSAQGSSRSRRDLATRQYVRFTRNDRNEITELWIYPSNTRELMKLGYDDSIGKD